MQNGAIEKGREGNKYSPFASALRAIAIHAAGAIGLVAAQFYGLKDIGGGDGTAGTTVTACAGATFCGAAAVSPLWALELGCDRSRHCLFENVEKKGVEDAMELGEVERNGRVKRSRDGGRSVLSRGRARIVADRDDRI